MLICGDVDVEMCRCGNGNVKLWMCGNVKMWRCGCVEMWMCRCGDMKMWRCGVIETHRCIQLFSTDENSLSL